MSNETLLFDSLHKFFKKLRRNYMNNDYVQYGCGLCAPEGWLNFDCSPTLRFERIPIVGSLYTKNAQRFPGNIRYGDIVKGLPIRENSISGIYCSHVLEHLALNDFEIALRNTYTYLKPGGTFRFIVPDLEILARTYLKDPDPLAALHFVESTCLGRKKRPRSVWALIIELLGSGAHLWMWDEKSLVYKLGKQGFRQIRRANYGDFEDKKFVEVEEKARFGHSLAIQCIK